MSLQLVGIIDYSGQVHCMEHASTVSSYDREVYSTSPECACWCGETLGSEFKVVPHPRVWPNYIDNPEV